MHPAPDWERHWHWPVLPLPRGLLPVQSNLLRWERVESFACSCMTGSLRFESRKTARGIAEAVDLHTHPVHQAQMQIAERRFLAENNAPAWL